MGHIGRVRAVTAISAICIVLFGVMYLHLYGTPYSITRHLIRSVTPPTDEEYRVYSAFVDEAFSPALSFRIVEIKPGEKLFVSPETSRMEVSKNDLAFYKRLEMVDDFNQQNLKSWSLEPKFESRFNVVLANHRGLQDGVGNLYLSRVGFDFTRQLAFVAYSLDCGPMCGATGSVVLKKSAGKWRVSEWGPSAAY